jgi:hypothetical protein
MVDQRQAQYPKSVLIEGSQHRGRYDSVISAIGQDADYPFLSEEVLSQIETKRGRISWRIAGEEPEIPSSLPAAGMSTPSEGPSVKIAKGQEAAQGADCILLGSKTPYSQKPSGPWIALHHESDEEEIA